MDSQWPHAGADNRFSHFRPTDALSLPLNPTEKETQMKSILMPTAFALVLAAGLIPAPVQAAGCLKGAAIGGVAGHLAGHHALLGAGAGCAIGHHEANKHARERAEEDRASGGTSGSGYSDPAASSRQ
jgi:hypothetical protein